jgi:hypothetical protein
VELVIDYENLKGTNDEVVMKVVGLVADIVQTFHFKSPYKMASHGDVENGLNWADCQIPYDELFHVRNGAVAAYVKLYRYGAAKCSFLSGPLVGSHQSEFGCPLPDGAQVT